MMGQVGFLEMLAESKTVLFLFPVGTKDDQLPFSYSHIQSLVCMPYVLGGNEKDSIPATGLNITEFQNMTLSQRPFCRLDR